MDTKIPVFLREVADLLDEDKLPETYKRIVSEFYMKYKFFDTCLKTDVETEDQQLLKFLSLGWYIHTQLLPKFTI